MSIPPILLVGGSGAIGRQTVQTLRAAHPELPLLIGGRDLTKTQNVAEEIGHAEGVVIDPEAGDLGLGERLVSAVAMFYADNSLAGLRFAQARGVPHLSISWGIHEIAPEVALFMHQPQRSAMVLGAEWLVGATTVPTLHFAKAFSRVDEIILGALVDEQDTGGPTVAEDFERIERTLPLSLVREGERYLWRSKDEASGEFRAIDGRVIPAAAFSSIDIMGLAAATGAPTVRFYLATGESSTRHRGEPMSTEIIIELAGEDHSGRALRTRHAVVHSGGAAPLTALGVAMLLERLTGLDGRAPTPAGLYFPYQLLESDAYLQRLTASGGATLKLDSF